MEKILHLSHTDIAYDSRILKILNASKNAGYEVFAIGMKSKLEEVGKRENLGATYIHSIVISARSINWVHKYLKRLIIYFEFFIKSYRLAVSYNPDIIHCNDNLVLPIALVLKFCTRASLIYDAHELESDKNGQGKLSGFFIKYFEKLSWRFIDGLIVVSPSIANWYNENIGFKNCAVVLNSPVINKFRDSKYNTYLRDTFKVPEGKKIFIYVGLLEEGRGIDLIENAFTNKSLNSHVIFIGYGSLKKRLNDLSLRLSNFHVHDAVTHDRLVEIVSSADVGLCLIENISLSDYFSLPNKLFEYCFAGIPVIASKFPDISMLVSRYNLGEVTDLDTESVVTAISSFEKGKFNDGFVVEDLHDLSWDAQAKKLLSFYKQILNK